MKVYRCNAKLLRSRFVVQTALIFIIYFFLALWYTADVEPAITQRKDLSEAAVSLPGSSDPATVFKTGILGDFEPSKSEKRFGYKGEIGEAVHVDMQIDEVKTAMHDYGYNSYVSDMIPLNRSIPDMRQDECQFWHYPESLPNASVVIAFHNEAWSPLLRTVHSVLNRSPSYLLEEIILVDDFSDKEHLGLRLDGYVQKLNGKVKILRNRAREGLIRTRTIGAQHAQGAVIIFLDAHCEVGINWLPPLLAPIRRNWKVMTVPIIDGIDQTTWRYSSVYGRRDVHYSGIFEWGLLYKEILINEKEMSGRTHDSEPFRSPTHAGGLFAISAKWFKNLGYYDPGLQIWGGEQYELSFKIWRCGGGILFVPCSHVGHVYRTHMPYNFGNLSGHPVIAQNLVRVVKIWMDEYASYYFIREPSAAQLSPGEISFQLRLKQLLKCHSFRWYMENVASDVLKSYPLLPNNLEWGEARNPDTNKCIDLGNKAIPAEMSVLPCHGLGGHQILRINVKGQLAQGEWCIMPRYNKLVADHCMKGKVDGPFEYDLKTQQIIYKTRFTCVTMSQFDDNDSLKLEECDRSNMYQRWVWKKIYRI